MKPESRAPQKDFVEHNADARDEAGRIAACESHCRKFRDHAVKPESRAPQKDFAFIDQGQ